MTCLSIGKKFEFAAAHKLSNPAWSNAQNAVAFGPESEGAYGHGHNFELIVTLTGPINPKLGMIMELSQVKDLITQNVLNRYDHRFLNMDHPFFNDHIPTCEWINTSLFQDISDVVSPQGLTLLQTELVEDAVSSSVKSADTLVKSHTIFLPGFTWLGANFDFGFNNIDFSHQMLGFGDVRVQLHFEGLIQDDSGYCHNPRTIQAKLHAVYQDCLTRFQNLPVSDRSVFLMVQTYWALLHDIDRLRGITLSLDHLSVFYEGCESAVFRFHSCLFATHRICLQDESDRTNELLFQKCYNQHGHGFDFSFECETCFVNRHDIDTFIRDMTMAIDQGLRPFQYRSLDTEVDLFRDKLCTCETMIPLFFDHFQQRLPYPLQGLSLQETPNNQFYFRRFT